MIIKKSNTRESDKLGADLEHIINLDGIQRISIYMKSADI